MTSRLQVFPRETPDVQFPRLTKSPPSTTGPFKPHISGKIIDLIVTKYLKTYLFCVASCRTYPIRTTIAILTNFVADATTLCSLLLVR